MAQLCLGTVQFGMKYGINNSFGQPSEQEVYQMLDLAIKKGIEIFDTAMAYGTAEELLGKYIARRRISGEKIKIISKLCPNSIVDSNDIENTIRDEIKGSLERLKLNKLYGYLLHTPEYIYDRDILNALQRVKRDGLVSHTGVSIYNIKEGEAAIQNEGIDFIQLPYSVLDQRGERSGFLREAKSRGIAIFARSAFLQGLFMMENERIPYFLNRAKPYLKDFERLLEKYKIDRVRALLNYPAHNPYIDYVVIGTDNTAQLEENIDKFNGSLPDEFVQEINGMFHDIDEGIILPSLWANGKKVEKE